MSLALCRHQQAVGLDICGLSIHHSDHLPATTRNRDLAEDGVRGQVNAGFLTHRRGVPRLSGSQFLVTSLIQDPADYPQGQNPLPSSQHRSD